MKILVFIFIITNLAFSQKIFAQATNSPGEGSSNLESDGSTVNQNTIVESGASTVFPPIPAYPTSGHPPQLFSTLGKTYTEAGLEVTQFFHSLCPARAERSVNITKRKLTGWFFGWFDDEKINFVPHIDYVLSESEKPFTSRVGVAKIGTQGYYRCVGIVTATAKPSDALEVSYASLLNRVLYLIARDLKAVDELELFIPNDAKIVTRIIGNYGINTGAGIGGSGLPGQGGFFGGTIGILFSGSDTYPQGMVGFTAPVFEKTTAQDPYAVHISFVDEKDMAGNTNLKSEVEAGKKSSVIQ